MKLTTLSLSTVASTLHVTLNRPDARNAMNLAMCEDLIATFDTLKSRADLRAVVLRAEGSAFCAGVDIKEMIGKDAAWVLMRRNLGIDAFLAIERCALPVIGVVHGSVLGAGAEMASACDFLIAANNAIFQWPEALRGAVGATQRLPRTVGRAMAKELLFTARKVHTDEAKSLGLVNHVVAPHLLDRTLSDTVVLIERCGPVAVRLIKQAVNLGENRDRSAAVDIERQLIEQSLQYPEWREGIENFLKNPRS
jgi:enoyl-CoA hydratase/carnithine racemase